MLVVQVVEIFWTKATRGAPRSNERASLPRAFPIAGASTGYLVQHYRMSEGESFVPRAGRPVVHASLSNAVNVVGALRIHLEEDGVFRLGLGTPNGGQPRRHARFGALSLQQGQYARLVVNARHTKSSGEQFYTEIVYNVTCGEEVPVNRFLTGPPDHELDLKAPLF